MINIETPDVTINVVSVLKIVGFVLILWVAGTIWGCITGRDA